MMRDTVAHTITEWEGILGDQVRAARLDAGLDQERLAERANVSPSAVSNLERGRGTSVRTLIAVVRALGRTDWLEGLAPPITVSPMRMLQGQHSPRQRVRRPGRPGGVA